MNAHAPALNPWPAIDAGPGSLPEPGSPPPPASSAPADGIAADPAQAGAIVRLAPRVLRAAASGLDWVFGLLSLVLGLAMFSVLPVLNFLSLGYLIHASGRVAVTGRLRDGFVGVRKASHLGGVLLGASLVLLPVRFVSGVWKDAELVAPGGRVATRWHAVLLALTVLAALHIVWACFRGGRLRHFFWPAPVRWVRWMATPGKAARLRDALTTFVAGLRLPYYFWLGARGFAGALAWLAVPVGLLFLAARLPPARGGGALSLLGGILLAPVVVHLPFLQARFGAENRFGALFEPGRIRRDFQRAPVAFLLALVATLLFALPLYLLKIELPPRELAWLPSVVFVLFIFPARLLIGWAAGRAARRERPSHWFFRWTSRLAILPVAVFYVLLVYFSQFVSWNGTFGLLEQHAFMVPAPLTSL